MASIKNLKKHINYTLSDVIDECLSKLSDDTKKSEIIIDEAIAVFDNLIAKVNAKNIENKKQYFKSMNDELTTKAQGLIEKINTL